MVNSNIISIVQGLRRTTANMAGLVDGKTERGDIGNESHGFTLEAITQFAGHIDTLAAELASAVGHVEPSADLLAARELAGEVIARIVGPIKLTDGGDCVTYPCGSIAALGVRRGAWDGISIIADILAAITKGRELAGMDADSQRATDMAAAPRQACTVAPDSLTITIDGPQGSGKTIVGEWLRQKFPTEMSRGGIVSKYVNPQIIEMREGRRFDVRNEVFLDSSEG